MNKTFGFFCTALLMLLLFAGPIRAGAQADFGYKDIKILSYNIKGLPAIAGGYNTATRFKKIGQILKSRRDQGDAPQIVLLQEAFINETESVRQISEYPFAMRGPLLSDRLKIYGSGLYLLSEYEITDAEKMMFDKNICVTWDCYAGKGVQKISLEIPDLPFPLVIANTHLQAEDKGENIRILQMQQLQVFLGQILSGKKPFIFAGDFNTNPTFKSYQYWVGATQLQNSGELCQQLAPACVIPQTTEVKDLVLNSDDQHFFQSGVEEVVRNGLTEQYQVEFFPISAERNFTELYQGRTLSDHKGYEVTYRIQWQKLNNNVSAL